MMANELRIAFQWEYTRDSVTRVWPAETQLITITSTVTTGGDKAIGVAAEQIPLGEVTVGGWWVVANRSSTAGEIIHLRDGAAGSNFATLDPGESFPIRFAAGVDLHAIAAAGTPRLEWKGLDD